MVLDAQTGEADVRVPLDALVTVKPENATTDLRVLRDAPLLFARGIKWTNW